MHIRSYHIILLSLILSVTTNLAFAQKVGTFLEDPAKDFEAITWSPNGHIYVLDFHAGNVYRIDGDSLLLLGSGYGSVIGGGLDIQGNYYFCAHSEGAIYRVNHDDSIEFFASGFSGPVGILESYDTKFFYVTDFDINGVRKVTKDGEVSEFVSMKGIRGPDGIVRMQNGDLLVSNFTNNRIHRIDASGNVHYFNSHSKNGNMGYITSAGSFFYVPSVRGHSIDQFDQLGNRVDFAGNGTVGYADGSAKEAQFSLPRGITSNPAGDTLLITEDVGRIRYITELIPKTIIENNEAIETQFSVFPNPTSDKIDLHFSCAKECQSLKIELLNSIGHKIKTINATAEDQNLQLEIRLDELPSGLYYLKVSDNYDNTMVKKIIKLLE